MVKVQCVGKVGKLNGLRVICTKESGDSTGTYIRIITADKGKMVIGRW